MPGGIEIAPRSLKRLLLALIILLTPFAARAADPVGVFVSLAADPSRQSEMMVKIAEWKLVGGQEDFSPLAHRLVLASKDQSNIQSATALAELAVFAAPGDPAVQYRMMTVALEKRDTGRAIRAGTLWVKNWFNDPYLQQATTARILLALGISALLATFAIILSTIPYYLPLAVHDLSDRFPARARKYAPIGTMLLMLAAIFTIGGGAAALIVAPALSIMLYAQLRVRIALVILVPTAMMAFPALSIVEKYASPVGEKAWAVSKVWRGDSGADLEEELGKHFAKNDYRFLVAKAFSARRMGEVERARALLREAAAAPGSDARFIMSQQGAVEYLLGNMNEAANFYRKAAEANSGDWRAWYDLSAVRLAQLDLAGAEAAKAKAVSISPAEVERQQAVSADAGGNIYPAFENFPASWISDAFAERDGPAEGWSESLWAWLGLSFGVLRPYWVLGLMLLGMVWAKAMDRFRPSKRCVSCGQIKCPRCHRIVKDPNLCGSCWAMNYDSTIDPDGRKRQREAITWWTIESRSARRWGNTLLPGWNNFVYAGGVGSLLAGALWALLIGLALAEGMCRVPLGGWASGALALPLLVALAVVYVINGIKSLHG